MHNHDEMVILCNKKYLGMSHKLNGTPTSIIIINGLKLHFYLSDLDEYTKCPVLNYELNMHENDIIS